MKRQNGYTLMELVVVLGLLTVVLFFGFVAYVVFHFVQKFW